MPYDHFSEGVFLELDSTRRIDIEKPMRFRVKGNDIVGPAAVVAAAGVSNKNNFRFTVTIEVLAGMGLIKDDAKSSRAEYRVTATVVDRRSTLIAAALAVASRAERDFVSIPQFLSVWMVRVFTRIKGVTGNFAQHVLGAERGQKMQRKDCQERNSSHE